MSLDANARHTDALTTNFFSVHPLLTVLLCLLPATPAISMTCFPSSASASSCSSSSTSHLASPPVRAPSSCVWHRRRHATPHLSISLSLQQSLAEGQQLRTKTLSSPTQEGVGFLLKDSCGGGGGSSKNSSSCDTDDFVIVPAHFTSKAVFPPRR